MEKASFAILYNMTYLKKILIILIFMTATGVMLAGIFTTFENQSNYLNDRIALLEAKIAKLETQLKLLSNQKPQIVKQEIVRREIIKAKSQEELLTDAVAKIVPSVVSIVVTKEVPTFEIVYENPFGDDPFFKDFDIRIPRYRRSGSTPKQVSAGTGFIITSNGYIITNRHVVDFSDAYFTVLISDGTQKRAKVVYMDPNIDIAVIKIDGSGYKAAQLGDSSRLLLGQTVFAVGNALGEYNNSVSIGIVSGLNRSIEASDRAGRTEKLVNVIQTDAAINPGNSGGPLVNLKGEVVGVNVAMARGSENIGFSIPINTVRSIINQVIK